MKGHGVGRVGSRGVGRQFACERQLNPGGDFILKSRS
jgi:hypothetical protein